jgi:hypothetical protein
MKEFMLYIQNEEGGKDHLDESAHYDFVKSCETYIGDLQTGKKLIAAQPILAGGKTLKKAGTEWEIRDLGSGKRGQVGYYHIRATDLHEAIEIAKGNPEFEFVPSASVEIREIKTKEETTGFEYPKQ